MPPKTTQSVEDYTETRKELSTGIESNVDRAIVVENERLVAEKCRSRLLRHSKRHLQPGLRRSSPENDILNGRCDQINRIPLLSRSQLWPYLIVASHQAHHLDFGLSLQLLNVGRVRLESREEICNRKSMLMKVDNDLNSFIVSRSPTRGFSAFEGLPASREEFRLDLITPHQNRLT